MRRRPFLVLALTAVAAAGCGATTSATSATSSAAGASTSATLSKQEQGVKWAECIREHGVPHFPDPDPTGKSNFGIDVPSNVFAAAVNACKSLQPPGALDASLTPAQQSAALKFARCVRQNGVPDFPDPVSGQPLIDTDKIPSANKPGGIDILNAATDKCGYLIKSTVGQ